MTQDNCEDAVIKVSDSVGEFIKYWGFKEIHGRIWTLIYLSPEPITAKDLTARLGVTKGLISIALAELIAYQVIEKVSLDDARSPGYQSVEDMMGVINNILRTRELRLITKIQQNVRCVAAKKDQTEIKEEKIVKLQEMADFGVESLTKLLNHKNISTERLLTLMRFIS